MRIPETFDRAACPRQPGGRRHLARRAPGFTLLEVLVALAILGIAATMVTGTFFAVTRAWRRGGELLQDLRHGDFVMDQVVASLRSAAFYRTSPARYGFWFQNGGTDHDEISWVCPGGRFLPQRSLEDRGLHRVQLSIETGPSGGPALAVRVQSLYTEDPLDQAEPVFLSERVEGFDCQIGVYNEDFEDWEWTDEWDEDQTNTLPHRVLITLSLSPLDYGEAPPQLRRIVDIPLGPLSTAKSSGPPAARRRPQRPSGRGPNDRPQLKKTKESRNPAARNPRP